MINSLILLLTHVPILRELRANGQLVQWGQFFCFRVLKVLGYYWSYFVAGDVHQLGKEVDVIGLCSNKRPGS